MSAEYVLPPMTDPDEVATWLRGELDDLHAIACDEDEYPREPWMSAFVRLSPYDVTLIAEALGRRIANRIADGVLDSGGDAAISDDMLNVERVRVFVCWQHRFVVRVLDSEMSTRGSPGHRAFGCDECAQVVADAFSCAEEARP